MEVQHMGKTRTRKLSGFRLLAGALVLYGIYLIGGHYQQLCEVRKERAAAEVRLEQLQQQRQALLEEKNRLQTPEYIEKLAREELGLAKPEEALYLAAPRR
ncbi:MAG: septum formation initiator family protein [Negativicutes bacterium]|jgi:cell division protein FtsL|nr:septum formation initiator family protein [Negativicutes bacterium]